MLYYLKKIYIIIFLPICLIIFCLRKIILLKFIQINTDNFGQLVQGSLIILNQKKKSNEINIFFKNQNNICNNFFFYKLKKKFFFLNIYFAKPIYIIFKRLSENFKIFRDHCSSNIFERDFSSALSKTKLVNFSENEKKIGENFFKKYAIKKKFVCLNVRDNFFKSTINSKINWSYHNYRNFRIEDFYPAIKYLNDNGYTVIRMGSTKLKKKNKNISFIDYANLKIPNKDLLDFYIVSKSTFVITTQTGFDAVPKIYNKKILQISTPLLHAETYYKNNLILTRRVRNKITKRTLSLKKTLKLNKYINGSHIYPERYLKNIYETEIINKDVLVNSIKEIIIKKKQKKINKIEKKFWKIFNQYSYNAPLYHKTIKASFSNSFLLKYKNWLN